MKTIDEIRRANLLTAIDRLGTAAALSDRAGVSAAYLSQVKNQHPESKTGKPKNMGDDVARKIEKALGEPEGWMDRDHTSPEVGDRSQSEDGPAKTSKLSVADEGRIRQLVGLLSGLLISGEMRSEELDAMIRGVQVRAHAQLPKVAASKLDSVLAAIERAESNDQGQRSDNDKRKGGRRSA